jgi:hypothetical protein
MMTIIEIASQIAAPLAGSIPGLVAGVAGYVRAKAAEAASDARVKEALAQAFEGMRKDLETTRGIAHEAISGLDKCKAREAALRKEMVDLREEIRSGKRTNPPDPLPIPEETSSARLEVVMRAKGDNR